MDFNSTFPLRYFINLGRRQDRRIETEIALEEAGISAERFPAVDARFVRRNRGYESAGRYALALTQRLVLRRAALLKAEAVLVLEDDVIFHPEMLRRLRDIELPDDWGIFYLGCAHHKRPRPAGHGLVRTPYALDTHAFAVRAPYYRQVIDALGRREGEPRLHARASDWYLADLHAEIPTYACYPNLAWQAVNRSDLANGTYSNYTGTGEQIASSGEMVGLQMEMWGGSRWRANHRATVASPPRAEPSADDGVIPFPPRAARSLPRATDPKLAMLFLTRGDVCHPEIWGEFFSDAEGEVLAFSHPKDREDAENGFLAGSVINDRHETTWGSISLVRAMLSLLKTAMADESITHFAFASETCVPVKPWAEIRRRLRIDPRSILTCADAEAMERIHMDRLRGVRDLPERAYRTHSQWILLDRDAADCVTEHDMTSRFEQIAAPDEHYFGTMLALRGYPEGEKTHRQDPTWVRWVGHRPHEAGKVAPELAAELAAFPGFFARKFPTGSDIGEWGLHRTR
jgi:hypothetical protein